MALKGAILSLMAMTLMSCVAVQYTDDTVFMSSGQAGAPEYPVKVSGKWCRDMDGIPGGCYLRWPNDKDILVEVLPVDYEYRIRILCSDNLGINQTFDVMANEPYAFVIPWQRFENEASFTCMGRVFPKDRPEPVSALFEVRVRVHDGAYQRREDMYHTRGYQIFGSGSRTVTYWKDGSQKLASKKTYLKTKEPVPAITESYNMRFNYRGL